MSKTNRVRAERKLPIQQLVVLGKSRWSHTLAVCFAVTDDNQEYVVLESPSPLPLSSPTSPPW